MLHVVLWKWFKEGFRETYTHEHVNVMAAMVRRNMNGTPHRIVCVTDDPGGIDMGIDVHQLWKEGAELENASGKHLPSCYRRLQIFDHETQVKMGIAKGDRIMSMDLDTVVTDDLTPITKRKEQFVGWAVRGTRHLRVFNGSLFMFDARKLPEVWTNFKGAASGQAAMKDGFFGSDQGWLSYNLARRRECAGVTYPQVVSYPREMVRRPRVPAGCAIVNFHGKKKPWHPDVQRESPWIKEHWRL